MTTTNPLNNATTESTPTSFCVDCDLPPAVGHSSREEGAKSRSVSLESDMNTASVFSCFCNLANTILGSGMLGLPYAFAHTGWVLGSLLIVLCGISSAFSLHTLALCAMTIPGPSSFYRVGHAAMPQLTLAIDFAVAIKCFGVATSYLIVIGDLMPDVMEHLGANSFWQDRHVWVVIGFIVVAPLSCLRNLDSLKFTSFVSIVFVAFLTMLIILYSCDVPDLDPCADVDDNDTCVGDKGNVTLTMQTLRVLSIFVFGFTCQQNIFAVCNELRNRTPSRVNMVIAAAIMTAIVLYLTVACFGYSTYGEEVESDILVNYPENYLTSTARLFVSLLVAFSYPLQAHPSRRCILTLMAALDNDKDEPSLHVQTMRYVGVTVGFLGLSLIIGLTVSDLGVVLSLVGATGSTIVSYILPGFFYYLIFKDLEGPVWKRNLALAQGVLGLIIIPVCLTFIFV
eukprot:CAMPEP_0185020326 /NCGR_PEP_ID=MMETSP1103-20130426/2919_1 /TAXON_ID=36769 /ORGANISM="Paraphysomonas bandaiensis, Strain Caron Lab Isolate" /LENGTH=453 /DNA_ID=CAMNT_0027551155 /DNA_START=88 /DNA_END=1449 /DNA_ORIENTATION=-